MNKREFIERLISMMGVYDVKQGMWERGWDAAISDAITIAEGLDESEKPVVPQFVAEYIEQSKKDNDSINQVFAFIDDKENKELWDWLFPSISDEKRTNQETFMRAWLDGFTVEKEKAYQVIFPDGSSLVSEAVCDFDNKNTFIGKPGDMGIHSFTEKTIKSLDPRYWVFAEEVTE